MDTFRTRSRVVNPDRGQLRTEHLDKNGNLLLTYYDDQTYLGSYENISDWNHPGFGLRSKSGELIIGELSLSKTRATVVPGFFEFPEGDSQTRYTGDMVSVFSRTNPPNLADRNSAIAQAKGNAAISALKKLNTAEVDMGENLGSLAQTVRMFRHPLSSASALLSKMEKRRWRLMKGKHRVEDYARATASTWLEYSFGFRPIIQDISKTVKLVCDHSERIESAVRVARGGARTQVTGSESSTYQHNSYNRYVGTIAEGYYDISTKIRIGTGVYYRFRIGYPLDYLSRGLGLGVNNLPSSAWNLLPHSWFVDQFVNVGDWIKALTPDPDIIILGKWMTTVEDTEHKQGCDLKIFRARGSDAPRWYNGSAGSRTNRVISVTRVPDIDLPSLPQFRPIWYGLAQAANNAAYGFQMLNTMLKRWSH